MIRIQHGKITWERGDVRVMARILGSEFAVVSRKKARGSAPLIPSILKLADQMGLPMSTKAEAVLARAKVDVVRTIQWKQRNDAVIPDPEAERYFRHQRADLATMYRLQRPGWLIASEAGVGKTLVGIRYTEHLGARRVMLIVPNPAKEQWAGEIRRWSTTAPRITIVQGTTKQQIAQITSAKRGWVIGHWESLVYARAGWLAGTWDVAILDEIQNIQNRNAQRTQTVHKIRALNRLAIGAHPYANGVSELFSALKFLYPDRYPSFWRWAHMHIQIEEGVFGGLDLRTPRRPKLLNWEMAPFTIRRLWKDVWKNLPPITRVRCTAHLSPRGLREYHKLRKQFFVELAAHHGEKKVLAIPSVLARVTRMRQYLIDPGLIGGKQASAKYPVVHELIKELGDRHPVIFTMWRQSAIRLRRYLEKRKLRVGMVVGGMSSAQVNRVKHRFLRGKYDAVIIMIKVGGTALNFGKYGTIIYLDHPWNQRDVEQTEGRVRRPEEGTGKIVPATSYHVIVEGSYEERMLQTRTDKHEDFAKVFTVAEAIEQDLEDMT
jgi:SNF2 family DNA or RNA helicase